MDDVGQRENGRHKSDQYKAFHTQVIRSKIFVQRGHSILINSL